MALGRRDKGYAGLICGLLLAVTNAATVLAQASRDETPVTGGPGAVPPLPADAPMPSSEPRNFEGTWAAEYFATPIGHDMYGRPVPLNAAGQKIVDRRVAADKAGIPYANPSNVCRPPSLPWQLIMNPFTVHQSKDWLELSFFYFHSRWNIAMDSSQALPPGGYLGSSVAHWDGETLIVETSGFKQAQWLDFKGTPASKDAKLTQRIRKVNTDKWYLEIIHTLDDPKYYTRPWSWAGLYAWHPDQLIYGEFNCEEQVGRNADSAIAGFLVEPAD